MKRIIAVISLSILLVTGLNSCKKCYVCTLRYHQTFNGADSLVTLTSEQCNSGNQSAGDNLSTAIKEIEANGYICKEK